jgi:hypothetical protein
MFWLVLFLGLVSCTQGTSGTPTPFPTPAAVSSIPSANIDILPLTIADLIATPEASQDAYVQLTGRYRRLPKLVCDADPHPSPATWELADGEALVLAGGFDGQLRSLVPDELIVTVQGRWLRWHGPIGCGKRAEVQEIWYLHVLRVIDPSPITAVTLTPIFTGTQVAVAPTISITPTDGGPPPEATPTLDVPPQPTSPPIEPPTETAVIEPTSIITDIIPTETKELEIEPTPVITETERTATPTLEPGNEATDTVGPSPTVTPTRDPNAPTPTTTPTLDPSAPTPTVTSTPSANNIADMGDIGEQELSVDTLEAGETHSWSFTVLSGEIITVSTGTIDNADLILAIVDDSGTVLHLQNNAGVGGIETIGSFALNAAGVYQIYVSAAGGQSAEYALMLLFSDSLNFIFRGIIEYGDTETGMMPQDSEHFWLFAGEDGDTLTITAVPNATTDVFLELYGPDATRISAPFINSGGDGVTEQLEFDLQETGLYAIRIGEWNFDPGSYQVSLNEN